MVRWGRARPRALYFELRRAEGIGGGARWAQGIKSTNWASDSELI